MTLRQLLVGTTLVLGSVLNYGRRAEFISASVYNQQILGQVRNDLPAKDLKTTLTRQLNF